MARPPGIMRLSTKSRQAAGHMLRAREPKEDAEPKVELRLWIDFEPFSTPSGNGRFLRTTAIDHRQTMAAFPTICRARATCSALDFASLPGPIQRDSSRPMRMF